LEARVKQLNADVKRLTNLNERFLAFVTDFVKVDSSGLNALALFIKAEDIENAMEDPQSYWLKSSRSHPGETTVREKTC